MELSLFTERGQQKIDLLLLLDQIIKEKERKWEGKDPKQGVKDHIIDPPTQKMQQEKQIDNVPKRCIIGLFLFLHFLSEGVI